MNFHGVSSDEWSAPVSAEGVHYLAAAASGLMSRPVLSTMVKHLELECAIGGFDAATEVGPVIARGYRAAASLLNCDIEEVSFVESGNRGLQSIFLTANLRAGDRVLVSRGEWGGSLAMLQSLDVCIEPLDCDEQGYVDLAKLESAIKGARMVLLTWVAATNGTLQPASEVGQIAAAAGVPFVIDACQVFGQLPVDVRALGCDALVSSGRKWLRGPRGTAIVFARKPFLARGANPLADQFGAPLRDGAWTMRDDARRFETGERCVAGRVALAAALVGAQMIGIDNVAAHCGQLASQLRAGLSEMPRVRVHEGRGHTSAMVTFSVYGISAEEAKASLTDVGFRVSAVAASYAPYDMQARGLSGVIRVAPHTYNTLSSIDAFIEAAEHLWPGKGT